MRMAVGSARDRECVHLDLPAFGCGAIEWLGVLAGAWRAGASAAKTDRRTQ